MRRRGFTFFFLVLLVGCDRPHSMPANSIWKGVVKLPDAIDVPFRMTLDFSSDKPSGFFLTGDEATPIPEISRNGDSVTLRFSEYSAEIQAAWNGSELRGNYLRIRSDETKSFPFAAMPQPQSTGASGNQIPDGAAPAGDYQVMFQEKDRVDDATAAKFWNKDGRLFGTFIAPDGDYGLLEGNIFDKKVHLTRFTGWQAMAIVLEPQSGTWIGSIYAASESRPHPFVLQPRADQSAETAGTKRTTLKNPGRPFEFSCTSPAGETVRDSDQRFKGKALIADIMGTWCHNCLDEAPVLQKLQEKFGNDGLEVVGLSFEISDDPAVAKKNLQLFKDRFGLTYTLLFCGNLDDDNVKQRIHAQLDNFFAYPTSLFIDRNHVVREIHSGFKGPGTADEYQKQIAAFEELTGNIVKISR
jgi:thiol-disulfide isomerase/thioredoxin